MGRSLGRAASVALSLALLGLALPALGEERPRLTFAQLADSMRANFDVTEQMKSYAGREVEIQGSSCPPAPPISRSSCSAAVSALGNYCCEVPTGQDETIYVFAARGVKLLYDPLRVYRVRGRFEAGKQVDPSYGVSMFRIRDARVRRQWARRSSR